MIDNAAFASSFGAESGLKETDIAVAVAWFLTESQSKPPSLVEVVEFIENYGLRNNINRSRLDRNMRKDKRVSAPKGRPISVQLEHRKDLHSKYCNYLDPSPVEIDNHILLATDFYGARKYVEAIVRQINGAYQYSLYDACAVMMRRLAEVLIIDAYIEANQDTKIRDNNGELVMFKGLVSALKSGQSFRLSRNAPTYLDNLKLLGDTAAHSRTYITKKKDIDDFIQRFRILVEELKSLSA